MYNPNLTRVCLLNVPLENDYKHTLWFSDTTAQTNYFLSKKVMEFTELTYQRKDRSIKVPKMYDELLGCNYIMYQNGMYNSKWFYAFITDIKYISDGVSEIVIETDCIQTWLKDYVVKTSFVEREHSYYDNIGDNTYPETVELGEYVVNHYEKDENLTKLKCVMASTVFPFDESELYGKTMNGMFSGLNYYVCDHLNQDSENQMKSQMQQAIDSVISTSNAEAIQSIFMSPEFLVDDKTGIMVNRSEEVEKYEKTVPKYYDSTGLDGYSPRNKKLFTHPYKHLRVSNGNSGEAIYKYEYFGHYDDNANNPSVATDCHFYVRGALAPGCSIRMTPHWYKGIAYNESEGLNAGKFPICNWSGDLFTNWMTQNGVNVVGSLINDTIGVASGVAMAGSGAGAIVGGASAVSSVTSIASTIREVKNAQMQPPQTYGNVNNGDVITSSYNNTFHFYDVSIKQEYSRIIDGYFDMFGYKTCLIKVPYTNHRERYWYTKTIDANIDGAIPNKDLQVIKNAYNNGITFWKNPSDIGNYPYYQNGTLYYSNNVTH